MAHTDATRPIKTLTDTEQRAAAARTSRTDREAVARRRKARRRRDRHQLRTTTDFDDYAAPVYRYDARTLPSW